MVLYDNIQTFHTVFNHHFLYLDVITFVPVCLFPKTVHYIHSIVIHIKIVLYSWVCSLAFRKIWFIFFLLKLESLINCVILIFFFNLNNWKIFSEKSNSLYFQYKKFKNIWKKIKASILYFEKYIFKSIYYCTCYVCSHSNA